MVVPEQGLGSRMREIKSVPTECSGYRVFVIDGTRRKLTEPQIRRLVPPSNQSFVVNADARRGAGKVQLFGHSDEIAKFAGLYRSPSQSKPWCPPA